MSTTDKSEWILLATNLTTRLSILPVGENSHLYFEINEPGSGELKIPLDSIAAGLITAGMFCECYYRGSSRGGFFVDNLKEVQVDASEAGGRWLSISGRGPLALLEDAIVWDDGTSSTTREFTSVTKASILITLITEAKARGALANLTYDFSASVDTVSTAWTDSEQYKLTVGTSLLDVARQFVVTGGFDFEINRVAGNFVLSAYAAGLGSNKAETIFLRSGTNCEEVSADERANDLRNATRVKYKSGYVTVSDGTSITAYRRRESLLSLEQAQSSTSATTYASARLANTKDPKRSIAVRVYDGIKPNLFLDYDMGDYLTLDVRGSESVYRVLGIQADFDGTDYSNVVLELNTILYDSQMGMEQDLEWLLEQWNTAKDGDLTEISQWLSIGQPNGKVNALILLGNKLYIGGAFTAIGTISANHIAIYDMVTGTVSQSLNGIPDEVLGFTIRFAELFTFTALNLYTQPISGGIPTPWVSVGLADSGVINTITSDDTYIFVGGSFLSVNGVFDSMVLKCFVVTGASTGLWTKVGNFTDVCHVLVADNTPDPNKKIYGTFATVDTTNVLQYIFPGAIAAQQTSITKRVYGLGYADGNLYFYSVANHLYKWNGVTVSATDLGAVTPNVSGNIPYASYLTDVFTSNVTIAGLSAYYPIKYSGGGFSQLSSVGGVNIFALASGNGNGVFPNNNDLYVGGDFTTIDGLAIQYLAVHVTTFQSLATHLQTDGGFDLGGAIHAATAAAIVDASEIPFWDSVTSALRKITWANIKATLKTYFDTLYVTLTTNQTITGTKTFQNPIQAIPNASGEAGIYIETNGDALPLDVEQLTVTPNITSATQFLYRATSGAGNITAPMIDGQSADSGVGTVSGDWITFKHETVEKFSVDFAGSPNIPTGQTYNINNVAHTHAAGAGDVVGPGSAVNNDVVAFDGVTGKLIKDSGVLTSDVSSAVSLKHTQGTDVALGTLGTKNPPIDADLAIYRDSTASSALVTSTWTQVKAFLKTYFDSIYQVAGTYLTSANIEDSIVDAHTTIAPSGNAVFDALALKVPTSRSVATTSPLAGGGDLSADRTFSIPAATASVAGHATAAQITKLDGIATGANLYVHPNHSGDVTSVADGAQTIADDAVTYAKMQNVSATDKLLGRSTAGSGDVEEIALTAAGRALIDDADAAAQRTTLGFTDANLSFTDITTNDASTTKHGFLIKATAPAANLMNVPGIVNGETVWTNKPVFDATAPTTIGISDAAAAGTSLLASHRDHRHASPATFTATAHNVFSAIHGDTTGAASPVDGDVIIGNVTPAWSKLAISIPAANVRNVLGIDNAELRPSWKAIFDATNPASIGTAAPGTSLSAAHRDHVHAITSITGRHWLPFATYVDLLPITATGKTPHLAGIDRNMTLIQWVQPCRVLTPSDASNYWTIQLNKEDGTLIATVTTATVNTTNWKNITASFTALALTSSTCPILYTAVSVKTGAPGALYLGAPVCEVSIP